MATSFIFIGAMVTTLVGWPCSLPLHLLLQPCNLLGSCTNRQAPKWISVIRYKKDPVPSNQLKCILNVKFAVYNSN